MFKSIWLSSAVMLTVISTSSNCFAQRSDSADAIGGVIGIIGSIAQGSQKQKAEAQWRALSQPMLFCMNAGLKLQNVNLLNLVNRGISPSDTRLAPLLQQCEVITSQTPKANVPCNVKNSKGQIISTM